MPIIPLESQKRGHKIGEIRFGAMVPKSGGGVRPGSLETIRLTTKWANVAEAAAAKFGGVATPTKLLNNEPTIEVLTTVTQLPVLVPPGEAVITQWREMWGKGYCDRRCDGVTEQLTQSPCICPADDQERVALAKEGKACKDTTRLSVMLPDLPGFGVWKVESKGWNAAVEMIDNADLLTAARDRNVFLPATLRLDPRQEKKKRNGKIETFRYVVPVLMVDNSLREIASGQVGSGIVAALPSSEMVALGTGQQNCASTATALPSHSDDEMASAGQKSAIRARMGLLSPATKATFDRWIQNEKKAGGIHSFVELRASEVETIMSKLDVLDPDNAPPEWDDDDIAVDAEIIETGSL